MPKAAHNISPRRLAANRANAARSTGPRTPQGKAISAQNARKHGFTAANFAVIRLEDLDAIARLKQDLVAARYQAQTERLYRRAVEEFERPRALRAELPNEPIVEAEPQEATPLIPLETNPLLVLNLDASREEP